MSIITGIYSSDKKNKTHDEEKSNLRLEHYYEIEKLNFAMLELRQQEIEWDRLITEERKKNEEILKDYENLKDSKQREQEKYDQRITELINNLEAIQSTKLNLTELEQKINQVSINNLELVEQGQNYIQKNNELEINLDKLEKNFAILSKEKEETNMKYIILFDTNIKEKTIFQNTINFLENDMRIILNNLNKSKKEVSNLVNDVTELFAQQNEYKIYIENLFSDKMKLEIELNLKDSEKAEKLLKNENNSVKEHLRFEIAEIDTKKLQEVLSSKYLLISFIGI